MEQSSMDHYERQLYAVFTTFADSSGTLDRSALTELCAALQMEASGAGELAALAERPGERVPFPRFRDALLAVLGAGGSGSGDGALPTSALDCNSDDESSGRELSPKLVYGSKKYGRRSRPRDTTEVPPNACDGSNETDMHRYGLPRVTSSPGEGWCEARTELDRCASIPGDQPSLSKTKEITTLDDFDPELDHNRIINCNEAIALCRSMQMGNVDGDLLRQVFEEGDGNECITVGEFFHLLNKKLICSITSASADTTTVPGGCGAVIETGTVEREVVVELWERAGVTHCRQMLHDLGFSGERILLTALSTALDEEIKSLLADVDKRAETNVPSLLLQASLSLHRHELRCVKDTMEQVFAENTKMKADLSEANQRAQVLAQEVDENHAKMEGSLRNKVKLLEARHAELMREAAEGWTQEKEATGVLLAQLQVRLSVIESEEAKQKARCTLLEKTNENLEKQLSNRQERIQELEQVKMQLTKEIRSLAAERAEIRVPGRDCLGEVDRLAELVSDFRIENKSLRDRNDELCAEIDGLQEKLTREKRRLSLGRSKPQGGVDISSEQAVSLLEECEVWGGGGGAVKRRGDSPSKGHSPSEDESPRIGKLRRYHGGRETNLDAETKNESGPEWELESCSDGGSLGLESGILLLSHLELQHEKKINEFNVGAKTIKVTTQKIRQALKSVPAEETSNCESCNTLKGILSMIHQEIDNVDSTTATDTLEDAPVCVEKPRVHIQTNCTQTDEQEPSDDKRTLESMQSELQSERKSHMEEKLKLNNVCRDLECSLEQLKAEYDKCEEYWANKLSEEREIFNEEQKISDDKFQDLLSKISEYEEQFSPKQKFGDRSGLETIEEKYSLELQFTDLEEEYQRYRLEKSEELQAKQQEINLLKEQVKHLEHIKTNVVNVDKTHNLNISPKKVYDSKVNIVSNVDDAIPQADSPIGYLWNQSTIQAPTKPDTLKRDTTRDYQNPAFTRTSNQNENFEENAKSFSDNERESSSLNPIKKPTTPKRCNSAERLNNPSAETEQYDAWCSGGGVWTGGGMIQCAELEGQLRRNAQTQEASSVARMALEQRCRQLQMALRQHQMYLDSVQQTAKSENSILRQKLFNAEAAIGKLQQRLTSADLLVKELYVENCQLSVRAPQLL